MTVPNGNGARERSRSRGEGESLVPIIDIGALSTNDKAAQKAVAQKIGKACEEIGFFVVVNHGIPSDVIDSAWNQTLDFFDLPLDEKKKYVSEDEAKNPYGHLAQLVWEKPLHYNSYSVLGGEQLSRGKDSTAEEMYQMGPKNPDAGMPPRNLPDQPSNFAEAWEAYYEHANQLAQRLLRAFAMALELPDDWFVGKTDKHVSALRSNNYPDQANMVVPEGSIRCSAHTDYGTLTILKSGGPGLQVSKDVENVCWHDENGFVINLGDLMRRWTNDRWSSTLHRVVNPPREKAATWGRRLAIAFFHNLNKDAMVEAIPSCVSKEQPALYDSIVAGEFLMLKHLASNGKADPDAHLKRTKAARHLADWPIGSIKLASAASWKEEAIGIARRVDWVDQWTLCPNTESRYLDPHLDTYNPDYSRFPQFAKAQCGQELLYYPAYWWHHTLQLETPSISYTGALVGVEADRFDLGADRKPHTRFYADLQEKCAKCWRKGVKERLVMAFELSWFSRTGLSLKAYSSGPNMPKPCTVEPVEPRSLNCDACDVGCLRLPRLIRSSKRLNTKATCEWIAQLLRPHGLQWTCELHRRVAGLAIKAGAVALIKRLQSLQIPLALCTSRKGDGLQALMDLRVQVVGAIDPRTGQQLKGKPDPEVYTACAEILGVEASQCVVFEDSPSGIQSAKAAGCFTVAVPEMWMIGDPAAEEVFALADLRLESLESLQADGAWNGLFGPLPPLLVGFGNPTVDVISVIHDLGPHLLEFGLSPGTEATGLQDSQKMALVELAMKNPSAKVAGGACMNTLRVASWWGQIRGAFIGAIGQDMEGLMIQEALVDAGVVPLLKQVEKKTGICGVLVDGKSRDRTLSMVRGAAAELDPEWLEKSSVSCLASMVYITSFVLTSQPRIAAAEALAESALRNSTARSRTRLCLNLSSAGLLQRVKDSLLHLLPKCSFLFGNCGELRAFAALLGWAPATDLELIKRLAAMLKPGGMAVITAGAEPTMVATGDGYVQCFPVSLNDFSTDSEDGTILHHNLVNRPTEFVKLCEGALQDLYREFFHKDDEQDMPHKVPLMQLSFKTDANLDGTLGSTKPKMIRDLTSDQVEKLVVIQGIVASVKTPRDKVRKVVLKCTNCENVEEVTVESGFTAAHIPSSCKGNAFRAGQMEKCPPNSFVAVGDLCEYAVDQSIRLQELPEHVPVGEMPRSIELCAQMYDVDRCTPGTRLTCIGIFCATEKAAGDKLTRGRSLWDRGGRATSYLSVLAGQKPMALEALRRELLAKGGLGSDWHKAVTRGLSAEDVAWNDGEAHGEAVLDIARACMTRMP
eukprot:s1327_g22.t1